MYYSNITNKEMQYFHNMLVPNFTIKLTDILHKTNDAFDNKLFKIEEIVANRIYRIYPIFYCNTITSTNTNDTILENKAIICQKLEKETYITFISDETADIQDYQSYATYFDIGDTLTTNQYNSIVSLLRQNTIFNDNIRINETVTGKYGTYEFDISDVTFLDTGIVITDDTITAQPKVKLTNPVFRWAKYTLQLTVMRYTGTNVTEEDVDLIETETIELVLTKNTWVNIPVTDLNNADIILFNANVKVSFDVPEIHQITDLEVYALPSVIQSGDNAEVYAQLLDTDGLEYNINDAIGKTIYFFEKLEPTLTLSASPSVIQSGGTSDVYCKVKDEDGSIAKNVQVHYFIENPIIYQPALDGTDAITSWTTSTNTTSDGVFTSHGSFLTNGWKNDGLWELEFDVQSSDWHYVGLMPVCSAEINPFTDANNNNYSLTCWEGINFFGGMGFTSWDSKDELTKITDSDWHHIVITKLSSTKLKIQIDDYTAVGNFSNLPNHSVLHIGTRDNPSSRNVGGVVNLKNINVYKLYDE